MNTPHTSMFTAILPTWNIVAVPSGLRFTSPCGRVEATLRLEVLTFGKGRKSITKTEWVLREKGQPGFDGIGNPDVQYFVCALEGAVLNADARERIAKEAREAKVAQMEKDAQAIHGMLADCGFFR